MALTSSRKRQDLMKGETMYDLDVYSLCGYALDEWESVKIYSIDRNEEVFEGTFEEARDSEYADCEIMSFEVVDGIFSINIE